MAAETALGIARAAWRRDRSRAAEAPQRVYQCDCGQWHLTHLDRYRYSFKSYEALP
jgi:hypothetical protein